MPHLLSVNGASVTYGSLVALENVSFAVDEGEFFCLVGRNGSGKSSLLQAIVGAAPLSAGSLSIAVPRERVSYMPQIARIPEGLPATAREVAMTGRQRGGWISIYSRHDKRATDEMLERLGVLHCSHQRIGELSGGQRRRVLLARALLREPKLLILDEPYAGLDEAIEQETRSLIGEMAGSGMTVMLVSHDHDEVMRMATRIAEIDRVLLFCGKPAEWIDYRRMNGR